MPLDELGNLLDQTPNSSQSVDIDSHAPPLYGEHVLDQLYADIDLSGMMTPGQQSGMNTPLYSHSRSGSTENLAFTMDAPVGTAVGPEALSSRLQDIAISPRNSSFLRRPQGQEQPSDDGGHLRHDSGSSSSMQQYAGQSSSFSGPSSTLAPRSDPLSRRTSEEDHPHAENIGSEATSGTLTPEHIDYSYTKSDLADLTKVPSYTTAIRVPFRALSSSSDLQHLPNYEAAISRPPSPVRGYSFLAAIPVPQRVRARSSTPRERVRERSRGRDSHNGGSSSSSGFFSQGYGHASDLGFGTSSNSNGRAFLSSLDAYHHRRSSGGSPRSGGSPGSASPPIVDGDTRGGGRFHHLRGRVHAQAH